MSGQDLTFDDMFAARRVIRTRLRDGTPVVRSVDPDEAARADEALRRNLPRLAAALGIDAEGKTHADLCRAVVRCLKMNHQHRPKAKDSRIQPKTRRRVAGG